MVKKIIKKKSIKQNTYVNFLLDTSGSMSTKKKETITSFNEYIKTLKKDKKSKYKFSLTKFSNQAIVVYNDMNIENVPELTNKTYEPDGFTALYDAIGITASKISNDAKDKILFVILTDGEENSSKEYATDSIKKLIEDKQKKNWTFTFMGCDIDAYATSSKFGILKGNTISFTSDNIRYNMMSLGRSTKQFAAGRQSATREFFTNIKGKGK